MTNFKFLAATTLALATGAAFAAGTTAGTSIVNVASANYTLVGAPGTPLTTNSNPVTTVVQAVYSFIITPDGAAVEVPSTQNTTAAQLGTDTVFKYTVTNTGNTPNDIALTLAQGITDDGDLSAYTFYPASADTSGNGSLDAAEIAAATAITGLTGLAADATATVFVVATVPAGAADGDTFNVNLVGTGKTPVAGEGGSATEATPPGNTLENWAQVTATDYSVKIGEWQDATSTIAGQASYDANGQSTSSIDRATTSDSQTITDTVYEGKTYYFQNTIQNTGSLSDSYGVTVAGVPTGWTVELLQADGVTPFTSTGTLASGATQDIVVKVTIPNTDNTNAATSLTLTVTGTSAGAPSDTTTDIVPDPKQYGVDVENNMGGVSTENSYTDTVDGVTGGDLVYPFTVTNTGDLPDTYNLAVGQIAGITPVIYKDADGSGDLSAGDTVVTDTGVIAAGATENFLAVFTVPALSTPLGDETPADDSAGTAVTPDGAGDNDFTITATSQAIAADPNLVGNPSDSVTDSGIIEEVVDITLVSDHTGVVTIPGEVIYTHTLTNLGNGPVKVDLPAVTSPNGWTYTYSTDGGTTWVTDITNLPLGPSDGKPGGSDEQTILVKVVADPNDPVGTPDTVTPTATATSTIPGSTKTDKDTDTDTTTVVGLGVTKAVDKATALPGDTLIYTITVSNSGDGNFENVVVKDPVQVAKLGSVNYTGVNCGTTDTDGSVNTAAVISNFATPLLTVTFAGSTFNKGDSCVITFTAVVK